ncbi:MAG: NrdH-redoxin [Candidatus Pacebacteria bacterium]|nr:NrdH-redoxin [Candidatus Paceibacterota bacterium]MCD8507904.1 NrdH-redoxin [Candidatus Paceibacterota bacterium]MCD8527892.1 NrdH-redoxin [Candidatus Paceibacterota bacterium]MCD8563556.1 NrdH-redoxin [Candidatus Paceibacterota bacterium]
MKKVEIYSTPTCHYCNLAKDYFDSEGVEYTEYNVAEDIAKRQEMVERSGQMGVPVIFIEDEMVIGFNQPRIEGLLGTS